MDTAVCGMLLSLAGNLSICQIVNPEKTVRLELSRKILKDLSIQLPKEQSPIRQQIEYNRIRF